MVSVRQMSRVVIRYAPLLAIMVLLGFAIANLSGILRNKERVSETGTGLPAVRVLSYSAFVDSWGPGPEIAALFQKQSGFDIEFQNAGDAGLLLQKMELFPTDVVVGLDRLNLAEATASRAWLMLPEDIVANPAVESRFQVSGFVPFDWAPMAFVMRSGERPSPTSLRDLLHPRFQGQVALQDPRTSTPGMQFFFWVLDRFGVEPGFDYLRALKPNVHSVSGAWSTAYGFFTKKQVGLVFSYLTSPVYHWVEEKNRSYEAVILEDPHPLQVEYAGIPKSCVNCDGALAFLRFLQEKTTQNLIMRKNYMFPVVPAAKDGEFTNLPQVSTLSPDRFVGLYQTKETLFKRWQELGL